MALTFPARSFAGSSVAGTLSVAITSGFTVGSTFGSASSLTGWTDVVPGGTFSGDVLIAVEYGTAYEEKILCTFNSGTGIFTIVTRNYDGGSYNTARNHPINSVFIIVFSATEAAELNAVTQAAKSVLTGAGSAVAGGNVTVTVSAPSLGSSGYVADAGHAHSITPTALSAWLSTTATTVTNLTIPTNNIVPGTDGQVLTTVAGATAWAAPANVNSIAGQAASGGTGVGSPGTWYDALPYPVTLSGFTKYAVFISAEVKNNGGSTGSINIGCAVDGATQSPSFNVGALSIPNGNATWITTMQPLTLTSASHTFDLVLTCGVGIGSGHAVLNSGYITVIGIA